MKKRRVYVAYILQKTVPAFQLSEDALLLSELALYHIFRGVA